MKKEKTIIINVPLLIISSCLIFLLSYAVVDATVTKPQINKQVDHITEGFDSLKVFLDAKIPEIDMALLKHEIQIQRQEKQLEKIEELTKSIKE